MAVTATDCTPRVWPACLACYNNGRLVGQWVDCTDAADVTLAQLHEGSGDPFPGCEEIWCLDVEHVPVRREMGLPEAAEWGHVYTEAGPGQWPAVCAWVASGSHVTEGTGDLPSISDFEERFCGRWDSFREYAEQLADDTGRSRTTSGRRRSPQAEPNGSDKTSSQRNFSRSGLSIGARYLLRHSPVCSGSRGGGTPTSN